MLTNSHSDTVLRLLKLVKTANMKGNTLMKNLNDNRVLGRRGARMITEDETSAVNGGIMTETKCSFGPTGVDGDLHTGDCVAN